MYQGGLLKKHKRDRLEAEGWRVGSAAEFLALSPEEAALVEIKVVLSRSLRLRRIKLGISRAVLARKLISSSSQVAKIESADPSVSVELLLRALFALEATPRDVGKELQAAGGETKPRAGLDPGLQALQTRSLNREDR
jgi:transcriptional regulator with XRE-family HTH domain